MTERNPAGAQNIDLGPGKEFDLVRTLLTTWGKSAQRIGDDAAILDIPPDQKLVVTTDTSVEGVHFRREWLTSFEIGYRATAAALSDLAAMAARPLGILIALTLPDSDKDDAREFATGIREGASAVMCPIVGGDLSSGRQLSLTITALGATPQPLTRAGAKAGQRVYVTGRLGGPDAAVRAWTSGRHPSDAERARFARPIPRIDAGFALVARGASAGIDISDGLMADLAHIAAASKVVLEIEVERIPRFDGVSATQAAGSGEEYEIVVTAPEIDTAQFTEELGLELTEIGRVVAGPPRVLLLEGGRQIKAPSGFDHFRVQ